MVEAALPYIRDPLYILVHFFILADCHISSKAYLAAQLLLSLYDSERFPFDVTELRRFDAKYLDMALQLLELNATRQMALHEWLNRMFGRKDFEMRFEHIAHAWDMGGKCERLYLQPVERFTLTDPI